MTLRHGYFTGANYVYGAHTEPFPDRLAFLSLLRSHRPPDLAGPFQVVELGCGQGFHLCLQAANYPQAHFLGIDFHPDHIAHGRSLAASAGLANITFLQADFLDLETSPPTARGIDWGAVDIVVAHGILGWVPPAVGSSLLRLASQALRPGGLFYLSYNALPGWLPAMPFQHGVRSLQSRQGDGLPALRACQELFTALREANAQLFTGQPALASRLEGLAKFDPAYLLHEYNHSQWHPLYANQVIEEAGERGLSFLGSATLADNFDGVLPEAYRQLLRQQGDPGLRELVRDLLTNQSFRRDVYVNGLDPLWPRDAMAALERLQVLGLLDQEARSAEGAFQFRLGFGEIQGNRDWFVAVMGLLADAPLSLADLLARLPSPTPLPEVLQNLALLLSRDALVLVPPARDPGPAHRFNAHLAARVAAGGPYRSLACPLSGNLRSLNDIEMIALDAVLQGCGDADLGAAIGRGLAALERQIQRDGQPLGEPERSRELEGVASRFLARTLPPLRRLGALP